jgi:MFS superfamily sulfate permease-like transporter
MKEIPLLISFIIILLIGISLLNSIVKNKQNWKNWCVIYTIILIVIFANL